MRFVSVGECMIEMAEGEQGSYKLGFAGDTLNTAWYVRALAPNDARVEYVTALGIDLQSDSIVAFLEDNGIGTNHIRRIPRRRPGLYLIHQAEGDRHFTYWRAQSAAKCLADDPKWLSGALSDAEYIYFSGVSLAILSPRARHTLLQAIANSSRDGSKIVFDPNYRPSLWRSRSAARKAMGDAARLANIVMPTFSDERSLFGDVSPEATVSRYRALGVKQVLVKNGGSAALLATDDEITFVHPATSVISVDPTGAGDSFNGAFLSLLLRGETPFSAARRAHSIAAQVIGHKGALLPMAQIKNAD